MNEDKSPTVLGLLSAAARLVGPLPFEAAQPMTTASLQTAEFSRKVDVYSPAPDTEKGVLSKTAILLVHGGGFLLGSRQMKPLRALATRFVQEGAWVCSMDYTLVPRGGTLRQAIREVEETLHWWRDFLTEHKAVPNQMAGMGLSAGAAPLFLAAGGGSGHLLDCLIGAYGAFRFSSEASPLVKSVYRRLLEREDESTWHRRSVLHMMDHAPNFHPTLFLHGQEDSVCQSTDSVQLHQARIEAGLVSHLAIYPASTHGFFNAPDRAPAPEAFANIVSFLQEHVPEAPR